MQYTVIIEKAGDNYSAYVPDLPGCVGAADTPDETLELMREAIEFTSRACDATATPCRRPRPRRPWSTWPPEPGATDAVVVSVSFGRRVLVADRAPAVAVRAVELARESLPGDLDRAQEGCRRPETDVVRENLQLPLVGRFEGEDAPSGMPVSGFHFSGACAFAADTAELRFVWPTRTPALSPSASPAPRSESC